MKTDDLVALLASGVLPTAPQAASRKLGIALGLGIPISLAILLAGFGLRPDLMAVINLPMFWVKLLFPLCIASAALVIVHRLARPGVRAGQAWLGFLVPVLLMGSLGVAALWRVSAQDWSMALLGQTWNTCVLSIGVISLPVLLATLVSLKWLAPTRPDLAGAAAGALAGGLGATIYALHCVEMAAPFVFVWYSASMLLMVFAGALLGARWLRW